MCAGSYLRAIVRPRRTSLTGDLRFSLTEILVMAGTARADRMAPPTSTRVSDGLNCVQEHNSPVNIIAYIAPWKAIFNQKP